MMSDRVLLRVFLTFVALVAVIAGCAYIAFGAMRLSLASIGDGERYALDLKTDGAQGSNPASSTPASSTLSIVRHGVNLAVQIDRPNSAGETYAGSWQKDGTLTVALADKTDPTPLEVRDYNLVAGSIVAAPSATKVNDTWKANLDVPYTNAQTVRVATQVTVIAVAGDSIELQAIGRGKATPSGGNRGGWGGRGNSGMQNGGYGAPGSTFPGGRRGGGFGRHGSPVDVSLNLDERFVDGRFLIARATVQTTPQDENQPETSVTWTLLPHH